MRYLFIIATIAIMTLVGCATPAPHRTETSVSRVNPCCQSPNSLPNGRDIARSATQFLGTKTIESHGRRIAYDCAGVTRAIYLQHGIDLYESGVNEPTANGVRLIYTYVRQHGRLHQGPVAKPGDLVFFNNTWDRNGDGVSNDPLTHVGVVERVEKDGTVVFISRVAEAVQRYRLNLALPHVHKTADGRVLNDYMRRKQPNDSDNIQRLTGELFAFFGTRLAS
jgi:hypothetical protein